VEFHSGLSREELGRSVLGGIPARLVRHFVAARRRPPAWSSPDMAYYALPAAQVSAAG
jgi:hypothetical protein